MSVNTKTWLIIFAFMQTVEIAINLIKNTKKVKKKLVRDSFEKTFFIKYSRWAYNRRMQDPKVGRDNVVTIDRGVSSQGV